MHPDKLLLVTSKFRVLERVYKSSAGEHARPIIEHPGAVVILPLVDDDHVCLIRNHRVAVDQELVELPAGTLEPGEDPLDTARRELTEETGYTAESLERLPAFWMSPGILQERMHSFVARGLVEGTQSLDVGERIEPLVVPWSAALEMCGSGEIEDAKTLATILYYEVFRRR